MKFLSSIRYSVLACGIIAASVMVTSCRMSIEPLRASERLKESPQVSVFTHNSKHFANNRDCYEVGPLPDRARRALITWLHDSVVKEMSYVNPQYYVTTYNARSNGELSGEVVWGILSDGKGNMTGVLVPTDKRVPAWDLPSVGSHKVYVCETSERKVLSDAIMEALAGANYDTKRIEFLKATGLDDPEYLISKPRSQEEQNKGKAEEKGGQKGQTGEGSKTADDVQPGGPSDSAKTSESDTSSDDEETSSSKKEEGTSSSETEDTSDDSSGDDTDTGSEEDSGDGEESSGEEE